MTRLVNLRAAALGLVAAATWIAAAPINAALAQQELSIPENAPLPPVATVRAMPPPIRIASVRAEPEPPPKATFRVRVTGAGQELWTGDMTLEGYQGAELKMSLQQADSACPGGNELHSNRRRIGLTFAMRYAGQREPESMAITAEWTRQSRDCAMPGTRTTGIETTIPIPQGPARVIEADGGLRMEITRKP